MMVDAERAYCAKCSHYAFRIVEHDDETHAICTCCGHVAIYPHDYRMKKRKWLTGRWNPFKDAIDAWVFFMFCLAVTVATPSAFVAILNDDFPIFVLSMCTAMTGFVSLGVLIALFLGCDK